jgi:hypothetical protein
MIILILILGNRSMSCVAIFVVKRGGALAREHLSSEFRKLLDAGQPWPVELSFA